LKVDTRTERCMREHYQRTSPWAGNPFRNDVLSYNIRTAASPLGSLDTQERPKSPLAGRKPHEIQLTGNRENSYGGQPCTSADLGVTRCMMETICKTLEGKAVQLFVTPPWSPGMQLEIPDYTSWNNEVSTSICLKLHSTSPLT
jgi:hypothetical protein